MARDTHDFSGEVNALTMGADYLAFADVPDIKDDATPFAYNLTESDIKKYEFDAKGCITVVLPSPVSNYYGVDYMPISDSMILRLSNSSNTYSGATAYTLTADQQQFFGVSTLYYKLGPDNQSGSYGPHFGFKYYENFNPDYFRGIWPVALHGEYDEDTTTTAYALIDSRFATSYGLNPNRCANLDDLRDTIITACEDAGLTVSTYTRVLNDYRVQDFVESVNDWWANGVEGTYIHAKFLREIFYGNYDSFQVATFNEQGVANVVVSTILDYIMNNWEDEDSTPNYYTYNWRKPDQWTYDLQLDKKSKRVAFTINKLTSGINLDSVGHGTVFSSTGLGLSATHRIYIKNGDSRRMIAMIEEANAPETRTTKASLYELVSDSKEYKDYAKGKDDSDTSSLEFINQIYVESTATVTVNGASTSYTYISGLTGKDATTCAYAYTIPVDASDTYSSDNVLSNTTGHCGADATFLAALQALASQVSGQIQSEVEDLANGMEAIANGDVDFSTFATETLTINYNGAEIDAPDDDTASLDVGCGGVMYRLGGLLDVTNLNRQLWAGANVDWNNLLCLFDNPLDGIYSLMSFPCDFDHAANASDVYIGNMLLADTSEMTAYRVTTRHAKIEFSFTPTGYYENFLDYAPYTSIQLHVPYYGLVDLPVDKVLDHDCKLIYYVDCNTGMARVQVKAYWSNKSTGSGKTGRSVVWESDVKISVDIPLNSTNFNEKVASMLTGIGATAMTGIGSLIPNTTMTIGNTAANAVSCLQNAVTFDNKVSKSGSFGASTSMLADRTVYLIYSRPIWSNSAQFNHDFGRKLNQRRSLGSVQGFTKTYNVDTSSIPATKSEQDMIKSYLDSGVYL